VTNDFLYQTVFVAKRLHRGEPWRVKDDVDRYMKGALLRMIEWHARTRRPDVAVWPEARLLERWADPRVLNALPTVSAAYDRSSVAHASYDAVGAWVRRAVAEFL
jgi:hypothetical protein